MKKKVNAVYADKYGNIFDNEKMSACAFNGREFVMPKREEYIPIPAYSKFFYIPDSYAIGFDPLKKKYRKIGKGYQAVSVFMRSGYVRLYHPAFIPKKNRKYLPLWAYSSIAFDGEKFLVPAVLIDNCHRWDPDNYDDGFLLSNIYKTKKEFSDNRLIKHLENCAVNYHCFAAKNLFLKRWEAPLPLSNKCNSRCLGCISLQDENLFPASHKRISFKPKVKEIVEIAVRHLELSNGIVSFGQGCEGEPLMESNLIKDSIKEIRKQTKKGVIHLNTNGYSPKKIMELAGAGLDSIRISINSARKLLYEAYYRPIGYSFDDVVDSVKVSVLEGLYTSLNYLVFPGITDEESEWQALSDIISSTNLHYIQLKNLNIDPLFYLEKMKGTGVLTNKLLGMRNFIEKLKKAFPNVLLGYFNKNREEIERHLKR